MLTTLALLLIGTVNHATVVEDRVSLVEVNHFYDNEARLVFDQLIFWDWHPAEGCYNVAAWRLLKSDSQLPTYEQGYYVTLWHDGDTLRRVKAKQYLESWTTYDPELHNRQFLPKEKRRLLQKSKYRSMEAFSSYQRRQASIPKCLGGRGK